MHIFHKWSRWQMYRERGTFYVHKTGFSHPYMETRQMRTCAVCGKVQTEFVADNEVPSPGQNLLSPGELPQEPAVREGAAL